MTNKKILSLSLMALAFCSLAVATEYKSPNVGFKTHVASSAEMKSADFGENYKVENGSTNDRQIASEEESSDRDPSSVEAKKKKEVDPAVTEEPVDAPKPWLYRNDIRNNH